MSTRATIKITQKKHVIRLYHHCDGYPEGVGEILKGFLSDKKYWYAEGIANDLVKNNGIDDDTFEITCSIHGDEEFLYLIDCEKKELKCYRILWNKTDADIIRPKNEVEI